MITKFSDFLNESATMDNIIYYALYSEIIDKIKIYKFHLRGDTFDIKEQLKILGFNWDTLERSWVFNQKITEDKIEEVCIPIFKKIEELGYIISSNSFNKHLIFDRFVNGYDTLIYPKITPGLEGKNIIKIKDWHHYAPMTGVYGNVVKNIKYILTNIYGLIFNSSSYMYQGLILDDEKKHLIEFLRKNNYVVEEIEE